MYLFVVFFELCRGGYPTYYSLLDYKFRPSDIEIVRIVHEIGCDISMQDGEFGVIKSKSLVFFIQKKVVILVS